MPTKAECKNGVHTLDNQGLCHWCGKLLDPYLWGIYTGESNGKQEAKAAHTTASEKV